MSGINDTAYPQLRTEISDQDLISVFTPSATERRFIANAYSRATTQALIAVQLKMLQRLGYFVTLDDVPSTIIKHICKRYQVQPFSAATLQRYDQSGSKSLHQRMLREFVGLRLLDTGAQDWLEAEAMKAAQTKQELPDIINILLEELVHHRYLLPGFVTLSRIASRARVKVNDELYKHIATALTDAQQAGIDQMFRTRKGRSQWDQLKREPKQPSVREVASFLTHIQALRELADGLPVIDG